MKWEVKVLVSQPGLTLCSPMDCSPLVSSVHGILQARILEWVAFPSPGGLPDTATDPGSPALQADSSPSEHQGSLLEGIFALKDNDRKLRISSFLCFYPGVVGTAPRCSSILGGQSPECTFGCPAQWWVYDGVPCIRADYKLRWMNNTE